MTSADQTLCRKLLSYRIENESGKPLIAFCIRKIGTVETIEIVFNFDQAHWFDFLTVRSSPEDFLEELIVILFRLLILNQQIYGNGNLIL